MMVFAASRTASVGRCESRSHEVLLAARVAEDAGALSDRVECEVLEKVPIVEQKSVHQILAGQAHGMFPDASVCNGQRDVRTPPADVEHQHGGSPRLFLLAKVLQGRLALGVERGFEADSGPYVLVEHLLVCVSHLRQGHRIGKAKLYVLQLRTFCNFGETHEYDVAEITHDPLPAAGVHGPFEADDNAWRCSESDRMYSVMRSTLASNSARSSHKGACPTSTVAGFRPSNSLSCMTVGNGWSTVAVGMN